MPAVTSSAVPVTGTARRPPRPRALVDHERGEDGHPGEVRDPDGEHHQHQRPAAADAVGAVAGAERGGRGAGRRAGSGGAGTAPGWRHTSRQRSLSVVNWKAPASASTRRPISQSRRASTAEPATARVHPASKRNAQSAERRPHQRVAGEEGGERAPRPRRPRRGHARRARSAGGSRAASSRRPSPARREEEQPARAAPAGRCSMSASWWSACAEPVAWAATASAQRRGDRGGDRERHAAPPCDRAAAVIRRGPAASRTGSRCGPRTTSASRARGARPEVVGDRDVRR